MVLKYHKAASLVRLLYGSATVSLDRKMETAKAIIAMPRYAPGKNRFRFLTCNGETLQLCEWARRTGIPLHTIMSRLKSGWLVERTLTPGIDGRNNLVSFRGQELPLSEWATLYGLTLSQLSSRIHKCNWPFEKALTTPVSPSAATRHGLTSSHSSR